MSWSRMVGALAVVYGALAGLLLLQQTTSASALALRPVREKQIKLEDIERDNLQTELLKQQPQQPAYQHHQHHHHHHQQPPQQPQQLEEGEQAYHPQHYHQPQQHFRYEPAALQHHQHPLQHQQNPLQHQHHLLLQAAAHSASAAAAQGTHGLVPTHVMYLIMPNGNVAAFQLAPHPNHLPAFYSPTAKPHLQHSALGTLYHQQAPALQYYQPQVQYIPGTPVASSHGQPSQRYQPATVHHQPTLSFNSAQAHQLHAQHFRELSPETSSPAETESYGQSGAAEQSHPHAAHAHTHAHALGLLQSPKSLFGAGVKATATPALKGGFSTQTGQSYTNFRQYG